LRLGGKYFDSTTDISEDTLTTISKRVADGGEGAEPSTLVAGLLLGSPEFQKQ
jgi:hypothetical protein